MKYSHTGEGFIDRRSSDIRRQTGSWQGPHEGKELDMLLAGVKPAALINNWELKEYQPYIDDGTFIMRPIDYGWKQYMKSPEYIIALKGQEYRLNKLWSELMKKTRDHAKLGLLLGYDREHIRIFCHFLKESVS